MENSGPTPAQPGAHLAYLQCLYTHFDLDSASKMPLQGLSLIDVGCGGGLLTEPMCRLGATVTGIDAGAETIERGPSSRRAAGLDINYRHTLPEDIDPERQKFDVVLNMEVVEHVADRALFLKIAATWLSRAEPWSSRPLTHLEVPGAGEDRGGIHFQMVAGRYTRLAKFCAPVGTGK